MNVRRIRQSLMAGLLLVSVAVPLQSAHGQDERSRKRQETAIKVISDLPWHKWLDEDVRYIITDQERSDFKKLTTNDQRDKFITDFWERRNPTPGATENKFKEEHYRRFAYANSHFAASVPGWKTDRGRIYIMYGTPDSIDAHSGSSPPLEVWHYPYIEGIGRNVVFDFLDKCRCGDYSLSKGNAEVDSIPRTSDHADPQ